MFQNLAEQNDIKTRVGKGKRLLLDVEMVRGDRDAVTFSCTPVGETDFLIQHAGRDLRAKIVSQRKLELAEGAQKHRREIRIRSQLQALARQPLGEAPCEYKTLEILLAIPGHLVHW